MSKQADQIIQVNVAIAAAGLGTANFGSAMLFADADEVDASASAKADLNKYRTYQSAQEVADVFPETTETYKAATKYLGGTPKNRSMMIWNTDKLDTTWTATLNKARNLTWWYQSFFTSGAYAAEADVLEIADWCEQNASWFPNCQTGAAVVQIRNETIDTDIASKLTALGYRHAQTFAHATDPYSGIAYDKHFAVVNYTGTDTTITGEFKKSPGVLAEDLTGSAMAAMEKPTKKATYYSVVELQGSSDMGRWLNTITHSTYGEYTDDVWNLDAFVNGLIVAIYNAMANVPRKLQQTPRGQAVLLAAARRIGNQYIRNGYLGPRVYTDPDTGAEDQYTEGFEILTKAEDILYISDVERNARFAAPINFRLFRAGAIHKAIVDVSVF